MSFPSPSLSPPSLENFQLQYNGLTIGANTAFGLLKAEGLAGVAIRNGDVNWPRDHGQALGLDLMGGRDPIIDLWVKAQGSSVQARQLELAAATGVQPAVELPLWFQLPNLPLLCCMCRPRDRKAIIDADYSAANIWKPEIPFHATDPRLYAAGAQVTLKLEAATGGLTFPVSFPVTFSATHPASAVVTNTGNIEMRPIIVFTGPLTGPQIANASITGEPTVQLVNPEGGETTIAAGDQVVVDLGTPHLARYYRGGVAGGLEPSNVLEWVTPGSVWWDLLPGENTIVFRAQSESAGTATIQYASAYSL